MGTGGDADSAFTNDFLGGQFLAIELFVGAAVGTQSRTFQGSSGEQAFVVRVGEDFGIHDDIGGAFGGAAFGTGGGRGIRAQFHFAVKQRSCAFRVHDQEYKVGGLAPQLESDTDAFERVQGWGSPLALVVLAAAADHHATSVAAPDAKCAFFTEGRMTRHSALSSRSWGTSSGMFKISFMTMPASLTRSASRSSSAKTAALDTSTTRKHAMNFFTNPSKEILRQQYLSCVTMLNPKPV